MKAIIFLLLIHVNFYMQAQSNQYAQKSFQTKVYDHRYVQLPPLFPQGVDSCKRFYFTHFSALDSLLYYAILYGDTLKYIRVYVSFEIDQYGFLFDPKLLKVGVTRYPQSFKTKDAGYLTENAVYLEKAIKRMLKQMPLWKPALQYGVPVRCKVEDYFQFWVGEKPPEQSYSAK